MAWLIAAMVVGTGLLLGLGLVDLERVHLAAGLVSRAQGDLERMGLAQGRATGLRLPSVLVRLIGWCQPLARSVTGPEARQGLAAELAVAGHPLGFDVESFAGFRLLLGLLGLLLGIYFESPLNAVLFGVGGYLGAGQWLKGQAASRQAQIRADLPDFLDAVAITLGAGAAVDGALQAVTARFDGPLKEEMEELNAQVALGVPRQQAFRQLMDRNRCRELEVLVLAMVHGISLGVPMAQTLEEQARAMRHSRSQRARQLAAAASPRITLVSTLLVTPSVLVLIIGLLILNFYLNENLYGFQDLFGNIQ